MSRLKAEWDVFISHAHEDKDPFVRELAEALHRAGLRVWYDDFTLLAGDSLRDSIDRGIADSRLGLVVLSKQFFRKNWTRHELNGIFALAATEGSRQLGVRARARRGGHPRCAPARRGRRRRAVSGEFHRAPFLH